MAAEVNISINATDNFSGVLGNFGSIITGIESAIRLVGDAFRAFTDLALEGLDAVAAYERMSVALTTLNAVQLVQQGNAENMAQAIEMSSERAEELLQWMQELAIHSPFTLEGVANAFRLSMAYGFTADEAQRLTEAFINFSAGTGATEYNMQLIARALGQISTAGRLMGQDMLQLTSAGLPVAQILADAFGVTTDQIIEMREDGLLPAQEVIEAITSWMETNFAGAADAFSNSWAGLMGTFSDLRQMGLRELFGDMLEVIQPLAIAFAEWFQSDGIERMRQWGTVLGDIAEHMLALSQNVQDMDFIELTQAFQDWVESIDWQELSDNLIDGINNIDWAVVGDVIGDGLQNVVEALAHIASQIDWGELFDAIVTALTDLFAGLAGYDGFEEMAIIISQVIAYEFRQIGIAIIEGIESGILWAWGNLISLITFGFDDIIRIVKDIFGISSPSSVFAEIGRNLVLGLITGWSGAFGAFATLVASGLSSLLGGGGQSVGVGGDSSSLTNALGGGTGIGGTVVNQYFAGATINVGSWDEIAYDCIYPNPFVAATSGQLGGGGGGFRT